MRGDGERADSPFFVRSAKSRIGESGYQYVMDPWRFTHLNESELAAKTRQIIGDTPHLIAILEGLRELGLPQGALVSGAIYNTIWNHLTAQPELTGIKDFDIVYFDDTDLSYDAEEKVIQRVGAAMPDFPRPVEVRNQARVHLWFEQKFGQPYPKLRSAMQSLEFYASRTHAIAAWLEDNGEIGLHAPFGLADIFALRITPNPVLDNRKAHEEKGASAKRTWPQIAVTPWPAGLVSGKTS